MLKARPTIVVHSDEVRAVEINPEVQEASDPVPLPGGNALIYFGPKPISESLKEIAGIEETPDGPQV